MPYEEYVEQNILKPLGMTSTTLEPTKVAADRLAHGYRWEDEQWKDEPPLPDGAFGSMGGMLTSIRRPEPATSRRFLDAWPPRDGPETGPIRRSSLREMQQLWRSAARASVTRRVRRALRILTSAATATGSDHADVRVRARSSRTAAACPGYGSLMRWLPEYGVGIIAFGNLTYTGWGGVVAQALDALARTGGSAAARGRSRRGARRRRATTVSRLVVRWDDRTRRQRSRREPVPRSVEGSPAAGDRRISARRSAPAGTGRAFDTVENALRGQWTMSCERGALQVAITLAPTMPPSVQYLAIRPAPAQPQAPGPCVSF